MRIQIGTNVSKETKRQVNKLREVYGYSIRDIITIAVDRFYTQVISENKNATQKVSRT